MAMQGPVVLGWRSRVLPRVLVVYVYQTKLPENDELSLQASSLCMSVHRQNVTPAEQIQARIIVQTALAWRLVACEECEIDRERPNRIQRS